VLGHATDRWKYLEQAMASYTYRDVAGPLSIWSEWRLSPGVSATSARPRWAWGGDETISPPERTEIAPWGGRESAPSEHPLPYSRSAPGRKAQKSSLAASPVDRQHGQRAGPSSGDGTRVRLFNELPALCSIERGHNEGGSWMELRAWRQRLMKPGKLIWRRRATMFLTGAASAALLISGATTPAAAATTQRLAVAVVGPGSVASTPAGISCPGHCTATFPAGTSVLLTATPENGSKFVRWGGSCAGAAMCHVKLTSSLVSAAAQFAAGPGSRPQTPSKTIAAPGSYSAPESGGHFYGFSFFVAPGGATLLNVAVTDIIACTPAGSFPDVDQLVIPQVTVQPNGSFSGTGTQEGVFDNARAKFTYSFAGHFEGATPSGPLTVAGTLRDNVVFPANGTTETCTTNVQPWTATHDPQAAPSKIAAVPGSYSAAESGGHFYGFSFNALPGGRSLSNISVTDIVACSPAGSFPDTSQLVIPEIGVQPNGSFSATTSQQGVFDNAKAKFTLSFAGHFEGATPSGPLTVAGTLREDIAFPANGTTETCTTNNQPWVAIRSS
jgi:hypothetical protein